MAGGGVGRFFQRELLTEGADHFVVTSGFGLFTFGR